jgi:N-acetylneuraminate synthase
LIKIDNVELVVNWQTIFIAEIASNFDKPLQTAKDLIYAAKEAGAEITKFQHYTADTFVTDF